MKINWKSRLRNKAVLVPLITVSVALIYKVACALGYNFMVDQQEIVEIFNNVVLILATLGIVVDPNSPGVNDSDDDISTKE